MNIRIAGYYTQVDYHFDFSDQFLNLLVNTIQNQILQDYFPLKNKELEIYIGTNGLDEEKKVEKLSKTNKGKYLRFHFWIPYPKVAEKQENRAVKIHLEAFTEEFFECLKVALAEYAIDEKHSQQAKETVLDALKNTHEYEYHISPQQSAWRENVEQIFADFEAKRGRK